MSKEGFIIDTLFLLVKKVRVPLKDMNYQAYGISRTTAWRTLRNLRQAGILEGNWNLTQNFREELKSVMCGSCHYPRIVEDRHRQQSEMMLARARSK